MTCTRLGDIVPEPTAFLAFGSERSDQTEMLTRAAAQIVDASGIDVLPWTELPIGGTVVINRICEQIAQRDLFICDLTSLNHNVLFELGFAIAQKKRTWVLLNDSIKGAAKDFKRFQLLSAIGYISYQNSDHIRERFVHEQPHRAQTTIYESAIEQVVGSAEQTLRASDKRALLYLMSPVETDAASRLSRAVFNAKLPYWTDDPTETPVQTLSWYAKHAFNAHAVLAHFLSPDHEESQVHNGKLAFVSGLAYGLNKSLLMLAHGPYDSVPFDYRELLKVHNTAEQCELIAKPWLKDQRDPFIEMLTVARRRRSQVGPQSDLQRVALGEYVSENEPEDLVEYFVETAEFNEALASRHSVVVGRKGSGKTANLLMLRDRLGEDKRNHVCVIKPVSYEFFGLLQLLEKTRQKAEKGYLFESLWKFLIYSELIASVYDRLHDRPDYLPLDEIEAEFVAYVDSNASVFLQDFSIRLENAVRRLSDVSGDAPGADQRQKISEQLHVDLLSRARALLGKVLTKNARVAVLIDNLDKAWVRGPQLELLGETLYRLFSVTQSITREFDRSDHWREPVNLSVTIFLRSDIFNYIHRSAREPDKISPKRLLWRDPELLLRVIEERFLRTAPKISSPDDLWQSYFPPQVAGQPTRTYVASAVLPKPRDIIFFIKESLALAINRRHARIEEQDILDAEERYSQHAFDGLVVEANSQAERVDDLLIEFAGMQAVVSKSDITSAMQRADLDPSKLNDYLETLVNLSFLGLETAAGTFTFFNDDNDIERAKAYTLARKTASTRGEEQHFEINRPFWRFLEVRQSI